MGQLSSGLSADRELIVADSGKVQRQMQRPARKQASTERNGAGGEQDREVGVSIEAPVHRNVSSHVQVGDTLCGGEDSELPRIEQRHIYGWHTFAYQMF